MANLTISSEIAIVDANVNMRPIQVGEAVTKFMPVYLNATTGTYMKCVSSSQVAATAGAIIHTPASTDGWALAFFPGSRINVASTFTAGDLHIVSATAGLVAEVGDLSAGQWQFVLGQAESASIFHFKPFGEAIQL